ncbi:MAG TPA: GtrA family protein [Telluria sp.]|nr:GtrA family protein [Telluria sp.]
MKRLAELLRPQFLVYLAGGVLSAAVDIGLLKLLVLRGVAPLPATSAGFLAGLVLNYVFHARVTFGAIASLRSVLRYLTLVGLNYLLTLAMVALSVRWWGDPIPGKLASLPLVAVNGFLIGKYWIFR